MKKFVYGIINHHVLIVMGGGLVGLVLLVLLFVAFIIEAFALFSGCSLSAA